MNYNLPYQTVSERKVVYEELLKHVDEYLIGYRYLCFKLFKITGGNPYDFDLPDKELVDKAFPELCNIINEKLLHQRLGHSLYHFKRPEALKEAIAECERILSQTTSKS